MKTVICPSLIYIICFIGVRHCWWYIYSGWPHRRVRLWSGGANKKIGTGQIELIKTKKNYRLKAQQQNQSNHEGN